MKRTTLSTKSLLCLTLCIGAVNLPTAYAQNSSSFSPTSPSTNGGNTAPNQNTTGTLQPNSTSSANLTSTSASVATNATSTRTPSPPPGGNNPLIPASISRRCQTFLAQLNGDNTIAACTLPLIETLELFAPEAGATTYTATPAQISASLDSLCAVNACSDAVVRAALTAFNGNCSAELQAGQPVVLGEYDTLYILQPFRTSVCSKDVNGGYCLTDIAEGAVPPSPNASISTNATSTIGVNATGLNSTVSPSTNSNATAVNASTSLNTTASPPKTNIMLAQVQQSISLVSPTELFVQFQVQAKRFLRRRQFGSPTPSNVTHISAPTNVSANGNASTPAVTAPAPITNASSLANVSSDLTGVLPNPTTWSAHSLPFLFLSGNMTSSLLCTSCTKAILTAYVSWEMRMPYALGLANSPMLGHQGELWTGIGDKCGGGFLSTIQAQAGDGGLISAASDRTLTHRTIVLALVTFVTLALLL